MITIEVRLNRLSDRARQSELWKIDNLISNERTFLERHKFPFEFFRNELASSGPTRSEWEFLMLNCVPWPHANLFNYYQPWMVINRATFSNRYLCIALGGQHPMSHRCDRQSIGSSIKLLSRQLWSTMTAGGLHRNGDSKQSMNISFVWLNDAGHRVESMMMHSVDLCGPRFLMASPCWPLWLKRVFFRGE